MRGRLSRNLTKIFLLICGIGFMFPMYWMISMSFKDIAEISMSPFGLPSTWNLDNYREALEIMDFWTVLRNSTVYTLGTCIVTLSFGSMAAYAVSRMGWKYGDRVREFFMLGLMIPAQLVMVPLYTIIFNMGLKNTIWAVILPYSAFQLPSTVLMLYAFLRGVPKDLDEAAKLDGCNAFQCFGNIFLPILKPALSTRFVLIFINIWNEYNLALILANTNSTRPISLELNKFSAALVGVLDWGRLSAAMLIISIPVIIVYAVGSNKIEDALCAGALLK